jgi:ribonucleotide reductase alpha subunit
MPTAGTSQIMGSSEGIDPYLTNVFTRSTLAGEFIVINENLINHLIEENIWSENLRKKIIISNGSIQLIKEIPDSIKRIYKTAFELKLKDIITQSAERGPFICQSQSLNLYMERSDFDILTSAHFYSWKCGLKTGMYYLRSRPSVDPIQFGIEAGEIEQIKKEIHNKIDYKIDDKVDENTIEPKIKCQFLRPGIKITDCIVCT